MVVFQFTALAAAFCGNPSIHPVSLHCLLEADRAATQTRYEDLLAAAERRDNRCDLIPETAQVMEQEKSLVVLEEKKPQNILIKFNSGLLSAMHMELFQDDLALVPAAIDISSLECENLMDCSSRALEKLDEAKVNAGKVRIQDSGANEKSQVSQGLMDRFDHDHHLRLLTLIQTHRLRKMEPSPLATLRYRIPGLVDKLQSETDDLFNTLRILNLKQSEKGLVLRTWKVVCRVIVPGVEACEQLLEELQMNAVLGFTMTIKFHFDYLLTITNATEIWIDRPLTPLQRLVGDLVQPRPNWTEMMAQSPQSWYEPHHKRMISTGGNLTLGVQHDDIPAAVASLCLATGGVLRESQSLVEAVRNQLWSTFELLDLLDKDLRSLQAATRFMQEWNLKAAYGESVHSELKVAQKKRASLMAFNIFQIVNNSWKATQESPQSDPAAGTISGRSSIFHTSTSHVSHVSHVSTESTTVAEDSQIRETPKAEF